MASPYAPVRKLAATDQVDAFDYDEAALNQFLQRYALVKPPQQASTFPHLPAIFPLGISSKARATA